MKTQNKKTIENNHTFSILDEIQEVKVNPFFKNEVLDKIRKQNEDSVTLRGWFTPQLQLAAVLVVFLINAIAIFYSLDLQSSVQELSGIEAFVEDYSLNSDTTLSLH